MKILLDYKIDIEVRESDKVKERLSVYFREYTRKELRETKELKKKFQKIIDKLKKIGKKQESLKKKASLYELNGEFEKSIKALEDSEQLDEKVEELVEELEAIGGEDQDVFAEELAKTRFLTLVSGKDFDKLRDIADIKGYANVLSILDKEKFELEKKQRGE